MANVATPFTGDRSKVKQVDPGKFLYEGNYYTGDWNNATNWGSDYSKIGVGAPETQYKIDDGGRSLPAPTDPWSHITPTTFPSGNPYPGGTPPTVPPDWFSSLSTLVSGQPVDRTNAPSSAATATPQTSFGNSTYDTIASYFRNFSNGAYNPTQQDVSQWGTNVDANYLNQIQGAIKNWWATQGSAQPGASQTPQTTTGGGGDWIDEALRLAESTDDPAYWRRVIAADPKVAAGDQSAIDYWKHRIAIGDGARAVREGRVSTFQDGGSPAAATGPMNFQQAIAYITQQIGRQPTEAEIAAQFAKRGGDRNSTFTAQSLAPVIGDLKGGGGTPAPAPTTTPGPDHGYDDPNAKFYLDEIMKRYNELNNTQPDPWEDLLKLFAMSRVGDLGGAPYTAGEDAALVTKYRDPLVQARDAELQQNKERIASRGMMPTSGLLDSLNRGTNANYQAGIAKGSNDLGVRAVDEKQRRADEQLTILNSIMGVNRQGVDRQNANRDQMLQLAKMFPDFDATRLNQLLSASGTSADTSGPLNSLMSMGNQNLDAVKLQQLLQQTANGNSQASSAAWGQILGYLLGAF